MDPEEALRKLARRDAPPVVSAQMVVSAVGGDGSVNLAYGNQVVVGVPALASYSGRTVGDKVTVLQTAAGWLVIGRAGAEVDTSVEWDEVTGKPTLTTVGWGVGAPAGTGWKQATALWVRDDEVYGELAAPDTPPVVRPPSRATVAPVSDAAYRFGRLEEDTADPVQGAWKFSSFGPYTGAWFYGTGIADAVAAGDVASITMRLYRKNSGGIYARESPHLYLHDHTVKTTAPPPMDTHWVAPGLQRGEVRTVTLPASWITAFKAGTAKGIGCFVTKGDDYIVYGPCGELTFTYQ